jgi:hypothetical protein
LSEVNVPHYDDYDDDDDLPRRRRRRYDDDDDYDDDYDDYDDMPRRRRPGSGSGGMATASMILGIIAVVSGIPGCLCGLFTLIALVGGIISVVLGFMSRDVPGSETNAQTGIVCGFVAVALGAIGVFTVIAFTFMRLRL